jgi:hypothetical protein
MFIQPSRIQSPSIAPLFTRSPAIKQKKSLPALNQPGDPESYCSYIAPAALAAAPPVNWLL